jgi:argininosuccinate lyase
MQEDKEAIFDAIDTVKMCLSVFAPMVATMKAVPENMYRAAGQGFINATDLADYLVRKGLPFRSAYKVVGQTVALCIKKGKVLEELSLEEYKEQCALFESDLYNEISLEACVAKRISRGSTGPESVKLQLSLMEEKIKELKA